MSGGYRRYFKYKDSGFKWLGKIPAHWNVERLGQFFEERREKVSDKDYPPLSVTMKGIVPQLENAAKTDAGDNRKLVLKNDFVINSRSDRKGSSGVSPYNGSVSLISIVLAPRRIQPAFVHHLLRSYPFQEEYYRHGKGIVADLWSTNYSEMKNILIPDIPEDEQTQIANFLDHETAKIDTLIEKQQQLIKLLKEKRQAVISHSVTKGLNLQTPMKDSGVEWLGKVPKHWNITEIRYVANQIGGGTPSKNREEYWTGDIPWVSPKDMKVDYIDNSQDKISDQAVNESSAKLVPKGSVLIVVRGMILIHSVPVALTLKRLTVNQDMKALIPANKVSGEYLLFLLMGLRDFILDLVDNSAHGTKCLRTEMFERMKIAIPNINEQKEIIAQLKKKLNGIDSLFEKTYLAIDLLKERRTALISAAVTGKIDVRNWQIPEQTQTSKEAAA